jgi:hypothetical protein
VPAAPAVPGLSARELGPCVAPPAPAPPP